MFEIKICDLRSAPDLIVYWATKTISLLDPGVELHGFRDTDHHIIRHFHDIDVASPGMIAPSQEVFDEIIRFSNQFEPHDKVLIHCHAGISRSTAIAIAVLIDRGVQCIDAFDIIRKTRSCLWPNAMITQMTDDHFMLSGMLANRVRDFKSQEFIDAADRLDSADHEAVIAMRGWIAMLDGETP